MKLSSIYDEYINIIENMTDEEWKDITIGAEKHTKDDWEIEMGTHKIVETDYQEVERRACKSYKVNTYLYQSVVAQNYEMFSIERTEGDAA